MDFKKFELNNNELELISKMIYDSNEEILKFAFGKNPKKAKKRIERLIQIGKNHYGHENIYIAYDECNIAGFFVGYAGFEQRERKNNTDFITFLKLMNAYGILKYKLFVRPLFMKISIVDMNEDDFYIDDIIVTKKYANKNLDKFLLEKSKEVAKTKNCKRLVTDVSIKQPKRKEFFENYEFKEYDKKTQKVKSEIIGNYFMKYQLVKK